MIKVFAQTILGKNIQFDKIFAFEFDSNRRVPASSFWFTALPINDFDEYEKVSVSLDGRVIFDGIVDTQEFNFDSNGKTMKICCRNIGGLLLDNEVKPCFYFKLTSDEVFNRFAKPYGVAKFDFPYNASKNFLQIKKGSCCYKLIEDFCMATYKKKPYLNSKNVMVLEPTTNVSHKISRNGEECWGLFGISCKKNRQKIISKVNVKTSTGAYGNEYGLCIENDFAVKKNILRERYFSPEAVNSVAVKEECDRLLSQSNAEFFEGTIYVPSIYFCEVGDNISMDCDGLCGDFYIDGVEFSGNENGFETTIHIRDKKFI